MDPFSHLRSSGCTAALLLKSEYGTIDMEQTISDRLNFSVISMQGTEGVLVNM